MTNANDNAECYPAGIVAMALNFAETIGESYEPDDALFNKLFWRAMTKVGYGNLSQEKLDRSTEYYLTKSEVDIFSLPEYGIELPDLDS